VGLIVRVSPEISAQRSLRTLRNEGLRVIRFEQKQASQMRKIVLLAGVATTLIVWTSLADPINVPKMFVLTIFAAWVIGLVLTCVFYSKTRHLSVGQWAIVGFALSILLAALLTDVKYTAFFGEMQRNDGALSYIALAILAFAAMMSFTSIDFGQLRWWILGIGSVLTAYGFLQTFGHDPFKWVLLYNHVVGTLGNPDFFSGIVGAAAIASVWLIFVEEQMQIRLAGVFLLLCELFVLKRCGSIQGIAAFLTGLVILLVAGVWQKQRRIGLAAIVAIGLVSVPVFFGLLNKGPFARFVYRGSFQSRVDYWHAALGMFQAHPLFGVGLDRFGQYYGQYAPQVQVVQGQASDNAHNVFLQLLATGGLLVILPYLFLLSVVFVSALRAIKKATGKAQIDLIALSAIWFALLFISFISIDNLGVAVWFWIVGGALYGISRNLLDEQPVVKLKVGRTSKRLAQDNSNFLAPIVAFLLSIILLILMVPAWRSSAMLLNLQRQRSGWTQAQYVEAIKQAASAQAGNIQVRVQLADISLRVSAFDEGLSLINSINKQDRRSIDGNTLGAIAFELSKKYESALPFRLRLLEIDPFSTRNMLGLVTDYVQLKDMAKAREMYSRLLKLYPNNPDTKSAQALIKG
jgi:O-antigen ligase